jgi:hypothetical protein
VTGTKTQTKARKNEENPRIQMQQGREYERCIIEEIPNSLGRESARQRKIMANFRCGNEERENRYWMEGEERMCKMYYEERDN